MTLARFLGFTSRLIAVVALSTLALAGGVRIVESTGTANFNNLQAAVDAAVDGDVLLVSGGNYAGFTIDNKTLVIAAAQPGALVWIDGTVKVQNLSGRHVVLCGLELRGPPVPSESPVLVLENNAGQVRFQGCTIRPAGEGDGWHTVIATGSDKVVFASCTIEGGRGYDTYMYPTGRGGDGLRAVSSQVLLYDTQLRGGKGGSGDDAHGADGGVAALLMSSVLFASGSTIAGGNGGNCYSYDVFPLHPGNGGAGLSLSSGASATLLDTPLTGGLPGFDLHFGGQGLPGPPLINNGGTLTTLPGIARKFTAAYASTDNTALAVTVRGLPGDRVFVAGSNLFGFAFAPALSGYWLIPIPFFAPSVPLGVVPPSGLLVVNVRLADLQAPALTSRIKFQGYVATAQGGAFIGSPFHVASLNRNVGPDCNANGISDFVDAIEGTVGVDCDKNLVHDACEIAGNDCNNNGQLDRCDIANGSSLDINLNGIPDECETPQSTWYVDDDAPPGGNGSAATPYTSLAQAFATALTGQTIRVADGTYAGSLNANLNFGSRELTVESLNGPANCVIALSGLSNGRAFNILQGQSTASRIVGFTIQGGGSSAIRIVDSSPLIQSCVFDTNAAFWQSDTGGGVSIDGGSPLVRDCTFRACSANHDGGAISIKGGAAQIEGCLFSANKSNRWGGGVFVEGDGSPSSVLISHCVFLGNQALPGFGISSGGAIALHADSSTTRYVVENSLVAGNYANYQGGGIDTYGLTTITGCTIVNNISGTGGGLYHWGSLDCALSDTILWNNSATNGKQIAILNQYAPLTVHSCDVQNGQAGVHFVWAGNLIWGAENISSDPAFVDRDGADNNPATLADNDWRLLVDSPCVDRGDNSLVAPDTLDLDGDGNVTEPTPVDLDGVRRFAEIPSAPNTGVGTAPFVDLGCYERQP